jgi:prepilin-type N-terminal cleavage/methylation domain-containing protein
VGLGQSGIAPMMKKLRRQYGSFPYNVKSKTKSQRGFTLIELIVVITIIVLLTGTLLTRVWFYQEQAEKAAMQQVAGAVQSALVLQYAHMLTNGREADVKNLVTENPIHWLMQMPPNYAGEYFAMTPASITAGSWAFDLNSRELIYVPYRNEYFIAGKDGYKWVRYRVRLQYDPVPGSKLSGSKSRGKVELTGVVFEQVEPSQWLIKDNK